MSDADRAPSAITLSYRYLPSDYARGLRAHYATRMHLRFDLACAVFLAIYCGYQVYVGDTYWFYEAGLGASAVLALLILCAMVIIPWLACRHERKRFVDYSLTFSPEGVHFRTADIDSQIAWSLYERALIVPHSYILYTGSSQFSVIPKRVFEGTDQQQSFEQLLSQHLPVERAGKKRDRGAGLRP